MNVYRVIDCVFDFFYKFIFFSLNWFKVCFEICFECDIVVWVDCELGIWFYFFYIGIKCVWFRNELERYVLL